MGTIPRKHTPLRRPAPTPDSEDEEEEVEEEPQIKTKHAGRTPKRPQVQYFNKNQIKSYNCHCTLTYEISDV